MLRNILIGVGLACVYAGRGYLPFGGSMFGLLPGGSILSAVAKPGPPAIPVDFPNDVPVYPKYKLEESYKRAGMTMLDLTVDSDPASVLTYYQQQFSAYGWQLSPVEAAETEDGAGQGFSAMKDGRSAGVVVTPWKDNRTSVQQFIR
jgi:hypothetical protein